MLHGLGAFIDINSVLSQLSWDTWHVGQLPSEDIFVVPKKIGEREFLFCREVGADDCCFEGSSVRRSICLTSASFGGARMLGFLAGISSSSGFISAAIVAISFLSLAFYAFAAIWIA